MCTCGEKSMYMYINALYYKNDKKLYMNLVYTHILDANNHRGGWGNQRMAYSNP